jgi:hypothetical protein
MILLLILLGLGVLFAAAVWPVPGYTDLDLLIECLDGE